MQKGTILDKLNSVLNFAGRIVLMNLLFLVSCLPVVTIGQAWCAMLTGIRFQIRGDSWFEGYKFGFKNRFWRGVIAWCVMLIPNIYFILDIHYGFANGYTVQMISASLMLAISTMFTAALLILNVYIPTRISLWITNSASMAFKAHVMLLVAAGLFWLPVLLGVLRPDILFFALLIFVFAYYPLLGWLTTLVLKGTIIDFLIEARAEGTLLREEGKRPDSEKVEE